MIIIEENKNFSYSLESIGIKKDDEEKKDIKVYQFALVLIAFEKEFNMFLDYDMDKKNLMGVCINQDLEKEEMEIAYTYVMMLREELNKHMKYMLNL